MSAGDRFSGRFAAAHARLRTAAVTGTNGKSTTTTMIAAVVAASGETAARLTTVGAWVGPHPIGGATPTDQFLGTVEAAVASGVRTLALEVTSKALLRGLARRWPPSVAVFTNLTRDHLDLHRTPEAYLAAKAQLFMALPAGGVAVLNADDPASALIEAVLPDGVSIRRYSARGHTADLGAERVIVGAGGTRVALAPSPLADRLPGGLRLTVVGAVHAENAMAAALACDALGYPADAITRGLGEFPGVPGRFEIIATSPLVVVDYAHTPDGLERTLQAGRGLAGAGGRLICVFGCGGERDRGKRPQMGAIAHRLADQVVLTSDNPRREDPAAIAAQVRGGAAGPGASWEVELDRAAAIATAIGRAGPGDVVLIAGKGHERVQEIGGAALPFSDVDVARCWLREPRR